MAVKLRMSYDEYDNLVESFENIQTQPAWPSHEQCDRIILQTTTKNVYKALKRLKVSFNLTFGQGLIPYLITEQPEKKKNNKENNEENKSEEKVTPKTKNNEEDEEIKEEEIEEDKQKLEDADNIYWSVFCSWLAYCIFLIEKGKVETKEQRYVKSNIYNFLYAHLDLYDPDEKNN